MKKFLAFALALMLAIPAMAFADGRDADITALGTATVTADPDQVTVIANASVTAKTVGETQEAMNKIIASVTDKLTQLGFLHFCAVIAALPSIIMTPIPRPSRAIRRIIRCASPATTSKCSTAWSAWSRTAA